MADDRRAQGRAMRRKLMGDAYADKLDNSVYQHPIMEKFAAYTQEAIFGIAVEPPWSGSKNPSAHLRYFRCPPRPRSRIETASPLRSQSGLDRG